MSASTAKLNISSIRSVPWSVTNALVVFILPWVLLPLLVVVGLQLLVPYVPSANGFLQGINNGDPGPSFVLVLVDAIGSLGLIGYYLHRNRAHLSDLGLRRFSFWKAVLLITIILVGFGFLVAGLYALVQVVDPSFNPDEAQTNEFTRSASSLSLWALVILPPIIEETVFRGFMFPALSKRYGIIFGAITSSILFGFAHLQANVSIYTFALGLLLCFLYTRLGSIIPGIALHMLNNYIAYVAIHQK